MLLRFTANADYNVSKIYFSYLILTNFRLPYNDKYNVDCVV